MKKFYAFLTLLALLLAVPLGTSAQDDLTVADDQATSSNLPIYGTWADAAQHNQILIPADMLSDMENSSIESMRFYAQSSPTYSSTITIQMVEVSDTSFSSAQLLTFANATTVYSGSIEFEDGELFFQFDNDYEYGGGNLLIDIQTTAGNWTSCTFTGMATDAAMSIYSYNTTTSTQNFIPKTTFEYTPLGGDVCRKVKNLAAGELGQTEATITWSDTINTAASFELQYFEVGNIAADTTTVNNITGTQHNITGLTPNTYYCVRVRAMCSDSNASGWTTAFFRTACGDMVLPYSEGFEGYVGTSFPPCWELLRPYYYVDYNGDTINMYPEMRSGGMSGNALYFYSSYYTDDDSSYFRTQAIPLEPNMVHASFWLNIDYGDVTVQAGFMTDSADLSTFVPLRTISNSTNGWRKYDVYSDNIPADAEQVYFAFCIKSTNNVSATLYIDNVLIEEASECRAPLSATPVDVTYQSAFLSWELANEGDYQYVVRYSTFADADVMVHDFDTTTVTTAATEYDTMTLTGLQPNTTYYAWVATVCGSDTIGWTPTYAFTTDYTCYPVQNLHVDGTIYEAASVSWDYGNNGRGYAETGAFVEVVDNSDSASNIRTFFVTGSQTFITDLVSGHNYSVTVTSHCDPDSASSSYTSFTTASCGTVLDDQNYNQSSSSTYNPFSYSGGEFHQTIYPASAVAGINEINGISYNVVSCGGTGAYTCDIYIGRTSLSDFGTNYEVDPLPLSGMTLVASGVEFSFDPTTSGWVTLPFDAPYQLVGSDNVVVTIISASDGTLSYLDAPAIMYYYDYDYSAPNCAVYATSYGGNIDPDNLEWPSATSSRVAIRFEGECTAACLAPLGAMASSTEDSASIEWIAAGEGSFVVSYRTYGGAWVTSAPTDETSYAIGDLNGGTVYQFRVGMLCTDGDTAWSMVFNGSTQCGNGVSLPYVNDFEGQKTYATPACWTYFGSNPNSEAFIYGYSSYSGSKSMVADVYSGDFYLVSPKLMAPANTIEIEFYTDNYSNTAEAGIMTNPTDASTFVPMVQIPSTDDYAYYSFSCAGLNAEDTIYLAFHITSTSSYGSYTYFDSVVILSTNCHRPLNINASSISHNSVTLAWDGNAENNYEIKIDTIGSFGAPSAQSYTAEAAIQYTIEELVANKNYFVWIRAYCADEETYTPWVSYQFRTPCAPAAMPMVEDFDASNTLNPCWNRYSGPAFSAQPTFGPIDYYPWSIAQGNSYLTLSGNAMAGTCYYSNNEWLVSQSVDINEPAVLTFDLYSAAEVYNSSTYSYEWGEANFDGNDRFVVGISTDYGKTWEPLLQFGSDPARDTMPLSALSNEPMSFMIDLDSYLNQDIRVAFFTGSTSGYNENYVFVDNVGVQSKACMRPARIASATTENSALVTWQNLSTDSTAFSLVLSTANTLDSAIQQVELCTDTFYTFNGLQPRTDYYVFVRSTCDPTMGYSRAKIRTQCAVPTLPFDEDFESDGSNGFITPECWTVLNEVSGYPTLNDYGHGSSQWSVALDGGTDTTGSVIASPYISAPLNSLYIDFWYYRESGSLEVGVMTDLEDSSTYQPIYTIDESVAQYMYLEHEVFTSDSVSTSAAGYVVFRTTGSGYLDDVFVAVDNSCHRTRSVRASSTTYYGTTVSWAPVDGDVQYRVKYSTENNIATADSLADVLDTAANLSGLHNGTTYYVWVQTVCADGSVSEPRGGKFTTRVSCYPVSNVQLFSTGYTVLGLEWNTTPAPEQEIQHIMIIAKDLTDPTAADIVLTTSDNEVYLTGLEPAHRYKLFFTTVCDPDSSTAYTMTVLTRGADCEAIENGTSTSSSVPFYTNYNNSATQVLYLASEIPNCPDTINALEFQMTSGTSNTNSIRYVDVYVGNTSLTSINYNNYVPQSQMVCVATNVEVDIAVIGWHTLAFTTPFAYTGNNLVVSIVDHTGNWYYSSSWKGATKTGRGIYYGNDASEVTIDNLSNGYTAGFLPNIRIQGNCEIATCFAPLAKVDTVTNNSATIKWMADGAATPWLVQYKVAGSNTTPWTDVNVAQTNTEYTITGLTDYTTYNVRVGSRCSGGDTIFDAIMSFTTECNTITELPWGENFDSIGSSMNNLRCWQVFHGFYIDINGTVASYGASGDWAVTTTAMDSSRHVKANIYGESCGKWLATPIIELDSSAQLSFDLALTDFNYADTIEELDEDDRFMVLVSTNGGHNWDVLAEWSSVATADYALSDLTVAAQSFTLLLSEYAGQSVRIAFYAESIMSGSDNDLHIDNVMIEHTSLVVCNAPVIASASTTTNSASMSWTGTAASYEVAIVEGAWTAPESGTATTQTSYTFDNLQPETVYAIGVRSVCGEQRSDWTTRTVMTQESTDGIDNVYDAAFGLFPNPASTSVSIVLDEAATVAIVDQSGRTAASYSLEAGTTVLDLSQCASGVYYVRVVSTSGTSVRKLVVK